MKNIVAMAGTLALSAGAYAGIVGAELTVADFSSGYVLADGSVDAASAAAVGAANPGVTVYRLWANVESLADTVAFLGASADDGVPWIVSGNFNQVVGGSDVGGVNVGFLGFVPGLAYDSFLNLGVADASDNSSAQDTEGWAAIFAGGSGFTSLNGGILDTSPTAGEDVVGGGATGFRVLLGQFAILDGDLEISGRIGGGGDAFDFSVSTIPAPGALALLGLAGVATRGRRRK